jgi:hypothetical protein
MDRSASVSGLLIRGLSNRVGPAAGAWLADAVAAMPGLYLADAAARRRLQVAYSQAVRHATRQPLAPTASEAVALAAARPHLDASRWTLDQAARAALLGALPDGDGDALVAAIDQLAAAADLHELIALYQALPVLPHGGRWAARAAEGVRSNMRAVFAAVALDNPYPAERLDEGAWNQLVLKCLFVGEPLHRVVGLDGRANPRLTRMLCDYAHERWAAKRAIPPGLWRCVGLAADDGALADLARVLDQGDEREREAARLALARCAHPGAGALLRGQPAATLGWDRIEVQA